MAQCLLCHISNQEVLPVGMSFNTCTKWRILFLPTAYVVRREGYVLTRLCLSTPGGGGFPGQVQMGVPCRGYPARGTPTSGTPSPCQTWLVSTLPGVPHLGYPLPPVGPDWWVPCQGYPTWGTLPPHPIGPGQGGTPPRVIDGVLDTPWSVCLLHSRIRTFLYWLMSYQNKKLFLVKKLLISVHILHT